MNAQLLCRRISFVIKTVVVHVTVEKIHMLVARHKEIINLVRVQNDKYLANKNMINLHHYVD